MPSPYYLDARSRKGILRALVSRLKADKGYLKDGSRSLQESNAELGVELKSGEREGKGEGLSPPRLKRGGRYSWPHRASRMFPGDMGSLVMRTPTAL